MVSQVQVTMHPPIQGRATIPRPLPPLLHEVCTLNAGGVHFHLRISVVVERALSAVADAASAN